MRKLLGGGWNLSVIENQDGTFLSVPVDSGFISDSFDFEITDEDLRVLKESSDRRATLELLLHEMLQPHLTMGQVGATDQECHAAIKTVIHGTVPQIEGLIGSSRNSGFIQHRLKQLGTTVFSG